MTERRNHWIVRADIDLSPKAVVDCAASYSTPAGWGKNRNSCCPQRTELVNELQETEEQLPSWNRRGGPKGRGGSKVEMALRNSKERMNGELFDLSTTPSLRDTPPVPGGELFLRLD